MSKKILITGGAGFIGSHLADELLKHGYEVRVLDSLSEQVHGKGTSRPYYLNADVDFVRGDIRDREAVEAALQGIDSVYHFTAMVGVGQSMYQIVDYTDVNNLGTATLLEALINRPVEKLVVASSMSIYGEGLYQNTRGELVPGCDRTIEQLKAHIWELSDENGEPLKPVGTPETKQPSLASVYALSKYDQERLCLIIGRTYNIPTVALRFFNVYGTRQALSNPYTGVLAIFASRLLNNNPPMIFEDGLQQRDFVSVYDVAQACRLALETPEASGQVFNVGSGHHYTVREIAERMARVMNKTEIEPQITGKYRAGDIRHCFADISLARRVLGYEPRVSFEKGLAELVEWLGGQAPVDRVAQASAELAARGLTVEPQIYMSRNGNGKKPVLITGGAGFIGTNVADRLLSQDQRVILFDNLSRPGVMKNLQWLRETYGERVQFVRGDIREAKAVAEAVKLAGKIFHFAAQVAVTTSLDDPLMDFETNARGTLNLLEATRQMDTPPPLVFTSTNKVYGDLADVKIGARGMRYEPQEEALRTHGISEARGVDFHSPYGCSKGAADQYVLDYARTFKIPAVVFRMSCIYGLHQFGNEDQGWVAHFLIRAIAGSPITIYGDGKQVRDILFVEDLVNAFLLAQENMSSLSGQAFNLGGGSANTISLLELLRIIEEVHGKRPEVRFSDWRAADQLYYVSDTRKFSQATGWRPSVPVTDGVARLYHWLLENVDSRSIADGRWSELNPPEPTVVRAAAPRSKRLMQSGTRKKLIAA